MVREAFKHGGSATNHTALSVGSITSLAFKESWPERLGFWRADAETDDLAPPFGGDRYGNYRSERNDAAAIAHSPAVGLSLTKPIELTTVSLDCNVAATIALTKGIEFWPYSDFALTMNAFDWYFILRY
jgi:hypothetical protein